MRCEDVRCNKSDFIVTGSLEGWLNKAKEVPSPREVRLIPLESVNLQIKH